jgi:ABC-type dipeptide/oligopeptide/nickel transport system permease subunit
MSASAPFTRVRLRRTAERFRFARSKAGRLGLALGVLILLLALCGPFFAPHSPSEIVGPAFEGPSKEFPLGLDFNGRDALSRVLWGGRSIVALATAATAIAYMLGITIGLVAGYARSLLDPALMRVMDVILSIPPLLFLLVLATGAGHSIVALVLGVALVNVPGISRIVRAATLDVSVRGYVEAAVARGERTRAILRHEILPNVGLTILADAGVRLTGSIILIASVSFLGLGLQPPSADWALMIAENRSGITFQPWPVAVPAILIALLTISVNLVADAGARSMGRSADLEQITR